MDRRDFIGLAAVLPALGCSTPGVKLDVPYVSTPTEVVSEMLRLAAVKRGDLLYDLGCGDGRIVIAAALEHGARGVGIDIDPRRIAEANAGARRAGVSDRVRFTQQDLFETDFREASVVTVYLYPELNARLKPKFLAELRPGSRVVSHQFRVGDWRPDEQASIDVRGQQHALYLYIVP
jgi:SAM-dependent methyltransferase